MKRPAECGGGEAWARARVGTSACVCVGRVLQEPGAELSLPRRVGPPGRGAWQTWWHAPDLHPSGGQKGPDLAVSREGPGVRKRNRRAREMGRVREPRDPLNKTGIEKAENENPRDARIDTIKTQEEREGKTGRDPQGDRRPAGSMGCLRLHRGVGEQKHPRARGTHLLGWRPCCTWPRVSCGDSMRRGCP